MSIYCTLWQLRFPADGECFTDDEEPGIVVFAQAVPNHIQDKVTWLPRSVPEDSLYHRAVIITTSDDEKGTERSGQEYRNPLLVLSGEQYSIRSFDELHTEICEAIRRRVRKNHRRMREKTRAST